MATGTLKQPALPSSYYAEASLIAGVFQYPHLIPEIAARAPESDFENPAMRALYSVAKRDAEIGRRPDYVSVYDRALSLEPDDDALRQAMQAAMGLDPTEDGMVDHAQRVQELATRRRLLSVLFSASAQLSREDASSDAVGREVVDRCEGILAGRSAEAQPLKVAVTADFAGRVAGYSRGVGQSLKSGVGWLDSRLRLRRDAIILIGAREKTGKTWLASQLAHSLAESGERVGWASSEMTTAEVGERVVGAYRGPRWLLDRDADSLEEATEALESAKTMPENPIFFWTEHNAVGLLAEAARLVAAKKITVLIVDYLQDMVCPRDYGDNPHETAPSFARRLKDFAQTHRCLVIAVSSMRKPLEENKPPAVGDLHGGAKLAYTANAALLMSRPSFKYPRLLRLALPIARGSEDRRVWYCERDTDDFRLRELPYQTAKNMIAEE